MSERPRARDIGLAPGTLPTGEHNAITDVAGVSVGHTTVIEGDDIRTGVTAITPAPGNLYTHPIPARIHIGNGCGKLVGYTQVHEFGEIETPIVLTNTLAAWTAADALREWCFRQPGMGEHTLNPVVGEINDGVVNNLWAQPIQPAHVFQALDTATDGPVAEGSVGGGTGSQTYAFKGGIGTSSRVLPQSDGGFRVGVLVQSNLLAGAFLTMNGAPVGRELAGEKYNRLYTPSSANAGEKRDGSIVMVIATDAPLESRTLDRLAARAMLGMARTGAIAEHGSGDYAIAFSTHPDVRRSRAAMAPVATSALPHAAMDPLFTAVVDATEEAIYNAVLKATTVESSRGRLAEIPIAAVTAILEKHRAI